MKIFNFVDRKEVACRVTLSLLLAIICIGVNAQSAGKLYLSNAVNGRVYDISALDGNLPGATVTYSPAASASNLAVGPNPSSTSTYVFTHSDTPSGSTVYVGAASTGATIPTQLGGLTANPTTSGATAGYVYGISSTKHLVKVSPALASDLGAISGDAFWAGATVSNDAFFDANGVMYTVAISGSDKYIYKIDVSALSAMQFVKLNGVLPTNFQGMGFYNGNIYVVEGVTKNGGLLDLIHNYFYANIYEINANNGNSVLKTSYQVGSAIGTVPTGNLDLASSDAYTPPSAPTCNELFGSTAATNAVTNVYRIDPSTLVTTLVANGAATNPGQGNLAYGPTAGNLNQNQFVTSPNNALGKIWTGVANSGMTTLTATTFNIGSAVADAPIGLGTDPSSGIVWGIAGKALTKWTGSGNATLEGNITGDANWTGGTTLNDIAVDNGGNLYCIISNGASNVWLYRINPTTRVAAPVVKVSGVYPTDLNTTNGNGLAYLGNYFYYSRINGTKTDIWKLDAMTGVSALVGSVNSYVFGDLASCATVTNVPTSFVFDCGNSIGGIVNQTLVADGTTQNSTLRIPISNAVNGLANITISAAGFSTSPSPYQVFISQGATYVDVPITYNGSAPLGNRSIIVTSPQATSGTCSINVTVYAPLSGNSSGTSVSICDNSSTTLTGGTVSGGNGTYNYLWESSADGSTGWGPAVGTNNLPNYTTNTLTTTSTQVYFRRAVSSAGLGDVSSAVKVTVNPLPDTHSVNGGGSYCAGGSGVPVGLDGSQSGVNYQLQLNGSNSGVSVAGTGAAISFGNQISAGTYTVVATNSSTGCSANMTGSITVTINPLPATPTVSSVMVSNTCPATTVNIKALVTLPSDGSTIMYKMTNDPNGADVTDPTAVGAGTYYIFYKNASGCSSYQATPVTVAIHSCNDLSITKAVSDMSPLVGSEVVFTIKAFNGSATAVTATEVKVTEKLLPHYEYKSYTATVGTSYDNTTGIWTVGTLAPGGSAELNITATVK